MAHVKKLVARTTAFVVRGFSQKARCGLAVLRMPCAHRPAADHRESMIRRHMLLRDRDRFLLLATLAAVLTLLAGGMNALAVNNNVWTVSKTSSNNTCQLTPTLVTTCNNISSAVSAASSGDIIVVGPGTYNESVIISTDSLSIFGAQAGKDARGGRDDPGRESIVDGSGTGNPTFTIAATAPYVVIDGFTIRGGTGTQYAGGIVLQNIPGPSEIVGVQVVNNIIEDNAGGVASFAASGILVERNLIKDNNAEAEFDSGCGVIAFGGDGGIGINDNKFEDNRAAAVCVFAVMLGTTTITNNTSESDGSLAVFLASQGCLFKHNRGKNFGANGVLPVNIAWPLLFFPSAEADAAIDIGWGNQILEISDNDLEEGRGSISNGVAFTTVFFGPSFYGYTDSEGVIIKDNRIKGFKQDGIVAESASGTGMTRYSSLVANEIKDNGQYGIDIEAATTYNTNISFFENHVVGNGVLDCNDNSAASGPSGYTLGTHDTWFYDIGNSSYPVGICTSRGWH